MGPTQIDLNSCQADEKKKRHPAPEVSQATETDPMAGVRAQAHTYARSKGTQQHAHVRVVHAYAAARIFTCSIVHAHTAARTYMRVLHVSPSGAA